MNLKIELPVGAKLEANYPDDLDPILVDLVFRSSLGILYGIDRLPNKETKRSFLVKFTSETVALAENAIRIIQFSREVENKDNFKEIVDNFLDSLSSQQPPPPKE